MLSMPSIWELIIPTVVFFAAALHFRRTLDEEDIPNGMTRSVLVFTLATVLSLVSGAAVSWVQEKFSKAPHAVQTPAEMPQVPRPEGAPLE